LYSSKGSKILIGILLPLCFFTGIWGLLVSQPKEIIHSDMIEFRQSRKNLRRDHTLAAFIIRVCSLRDIDLLADLSLREIRIFS